MGSEWRLTRGGEILAFLRLCDHWRFADYPMVEASAQTTFGFETVRCLFEREVELLDVDTESENSEWADIWEELQAPGLFLESSDAQERIAILWIHFKAGRAWWFPLYNSPLTVTRPRG